MAESLRGLCTDGAACPCHLNDEPDMPARRSRGRQGRASSRDSALRPLAPRTVTVEQMDDAWYAATTHPDGQRGVTAPRFLAAPGITVTEHEDANE